MRRALLMRVASTVAIFVFTALFQTSFADESEPVPQEQLLTGMRYGIQLDAGSSGTRAYVYKWKARVYG